MRIIRVTIEISFFSFFRHLLKVLLELSEGLSGFALRNGTI